MADIIRNLEVRQVRLDTAEAELSVRVELSEPATGVELRGTFHGPRSPHETTLEGSHPILPPIQPKESEFGVLCGRIIIAEPIFWTQQRPFVYEGTVELWRTDDTGLTSRQVECRSVTVRFRG